SSRRSAAWPSGAPPLPALADRSPGILAGVRLLKRRRRLAGAIAVGVAALAGAAAAFALLWLSPREAPGRAVATVGDDYYANLKHRPKLVEPEAGDTSGVVSGSYRVAEPTVGGGAR